MHPAEPDYSTSAREVTDITVLAEREHRDWGACRLSLGEVDVSHQVVSFLRRRQPGGEVLGEEPLDLPERSLRTTAVWWTVPADLLAESGLAAADLPGAAHAAEHCSIGLLPLFATCDRWDIGGVSTALHADTGRLTVFVHDGHPGGAGLRRARLPRRARVADRDPRGDRRLRVRDRAAPRASSRPSAATRTTRSTSPARSRCWTCCWPMRRVGSLPPW